MTLQFKRLILHNPKRLIKILPITRRKEEKRIRLNLKAYRLAKIEKVRKAKTKKAKFHLMILRDFNNQCIVAKL